MTTSPAARPEIDSLQVFRWLSHGLLIGGFLLMMLDIRFEHRQVVGEEPIAWVPIFFSGAMLVLIPLGVATWKIGGKRLLTVCYLGAILVGMIGIYFHADGHLLARLREVFAVWSAWVTKIEPSAPFYPPILAPFAFLGLGSIGLVFTYSERVRS